MLSVEGRSALALVLGTIVVAGSARVELAESAFLVFAARDGLLLSMILFCCAKTRYQRQEFTVPEIKRRQTLCSIRLDHRVLEIEF